MMQNAVPAGGHISTVLGYLPLLFLIAGQCLPGQTVPPPENPTISVDVNLVVLHATVLDRKGGFVSGLQKEGFHVYEDGAPQVIRVFDHEDVPVAVGLAVDNSGSMSRKRKDVTAAALAFVRASNPLDEMFVVNFNELVLSGCPIPDSFRPAPRNWSEHSTAFLRVAGRRYTMPSKPAESSEESHARQEGSDRNQRWRR
jgi:hypothetical protein